MAESHPRPSDAGPPPPGDDPPKSDPTPPPAASQPEPDPDPSPEPSKDDPPKEPRAQTMRLDDDQLKEFGQRIVDGVTGGVVERIKPDQPPKSAVENEPHEPAQPPPPPKQEEYVHPFDRPLFGRRKRAG